MIEIDTFRVILLQYRNIEKGMAYRSRAFFVCKGVGAMPTIGR